MPQWMISTENYHLRRTLWQNLGAKSEESDKLLGYRLDNFNELKNLIKVHCHPVGKSASIIIKDALADFVDGLKGEQRHFCMVAMTRQIRKHSRSMFEDK